VVCCVRPVYGCTVYRVYVYICMYRYIYIYMYVCGRAGQQQQQQQQVSVRTAYGVRRTAGVRAVPVQPYPDMRCMHRVPSGEILKSAQQGYQNPLLYVPPEKPSAAAEIERQLRRLVVFPPQRPPSERHSCAEVPVRRRDVRGVRLGPVAADPLSRHIRAWW
jgi:hypothetical protein